MKVALCANTDWYLYSFRQQLARELKKRGHQVYLVSPPGKYQNFLRRGFFSRSLRLSRSGINLINELRSLLEFVRIYQREKFDVTHHFTIKPIIYGSIAAKLSKTPRILNSITGLGYAFMGDTQRIWLVNSLVILMYKFALKKTTVIFQNQEDLDFFITKRIVRKGQSVLIRGSGVDLKKFSYKPEPKGKPRVIMVSRLLWEKGVGEFVQAARTINSAKSKAEFILVGDIDTGNPGSVPLSVLKSWVAEGRIRWTGWSNDMPRIFQKANIVCLPSYREGLPKALLEAAASGRAIVATDVPGCREVVKYGVNGILVPAREVKALVTALEHLIKDAGLRKKMGKAGRGIASKYFSVRQINKETLALYTKQG